MPLAQVLPGTSAQRTNLLNAIFFISRQNQSWVGTGYFVDNTSTNFLYPLYRFTSTTNIQKNPDTLYLNFYNAVVNNINTGVWTNMSHMMDGVLHLDAHASDPHGASVGYGYTNAYNVYTEPVVNEPWVYFFSNTIPAAVEVQMGVLEDRVLARAQSLPNNLPSPPPNDLRTQFLQNQSGAVHIFRETVNIENVDRTAYQ